MHSSTCNYNEHPGALTPEMLSQRGRSNNRDLREKAKLIGREKKWGNRMGGREEDWLTLSGRNELRHKLTCSKRTD